MNTEQIEESVRQEWVEGILEIECKECGATIVAELDATDLYCQECKMIIMQTY